VDESKPIAAPLPNGSVHSPPASLAGSRKYGILIAEDDPDVRDVLAFGMRRSGFRVLSAADGHLALEIYRDHRQSIDAALLDVQMPGLDGPQTFTKLRRLSPWLVCCFMSGDVGGYDEKMLRDLGAAAIFNKPFRVAEVSQTILKLLTRDPYRHIPQVAVPEIRRTFRQVS
jgi:DNA-binding response OmpR family regulator